MSSGSDGGSPPAAPSVSVIIPTHDRADFVSEAIASVLAQEHAAGEVVVVDDNSGDHTQEVLSEFGNAVRVLRSETNIERGAARNLGARRADGEMLAFLDSDDIWEPQKLARQLDAVGDRAPSVTGIRFIDRRGQSFGRPYLPHTASEQELPIYNYCLASPSTMLVPKTAFEDVGGFPEERVYQGSEDWIFLVQLLWQGWPIRVVREPLVGYRVHPDSGTQRPENLERSMWAACRWIDEQSTGPPRLAANRHSRAAAAIGCAYVAGGRWRRGGRWARRALSEGSPGIRIHAAWRLLRTAVRWLTARPRPRS